MFASYTDAFRHLQLPRSKVLRTARSRRSWMGRVAAWLVGGLDNGGEPDATGELPEPYLANNHLRRDIGLPPVSARGWPY